MPLTLRQIYSASSYGHPELHDCGPDGDPHHHASSTNPAQTQASTAKTILQDCGTSATLGALHQIAYLSSYALEIFDGLVSLADETKERVSSCSARVGALSSLLSRTSASMGTVANSNMLQREVFVPTVLSKSTNSPSVSQTWDGCSAPPQFWRMDKVLLSLGLEPASSNSIYFSNPGFFFQEWVRVEQERQSMIRADRKKEKAARKERKLERRKLRERGDKHWADHTKLGESRRRRASDFDMDFDPHATGSVRSSMGTHSERSSGRSDRSSPSSRSSVPRTSSSTSTSASASGSATGTDSPSDSDVSNSAASSDSGDGDLSAIEEEEPDDEPSDSDDSSNSRSPPPSSSAPPSEPATPSGSERSGRRGKESLESPALSDVPTPSTVRSPASPMTPPPPPPTPPPPPPPPSGPSPPKQGAMSSIRGIFGGQIAAAPRASTFHGARPSVLARKSTFHGARNAFVPKLVTEARQSVRPSGLAVVAAAAAPPPAWGLGSIFKSTPSSSSAAAAAASSERKGGDSDSDEDDKAQARRVVLARSRSKTGSVMSSTTLRSLQHEPIRRTDSHSTINTEHSAYAKPALPATSDSRTPQAAGGGFMSSLTSIFRGGKSASAAASTTAAQSSPAMLSALPEGDDEDRPDSARPRGSSKSSLWRASIDSSPPPPSDEDDDDEEEQDRRNTRMFGRRSDDEPPDSDDEAPSEAPSATAKKTPPPPPSPPLRKSVATRRKSSFFNSQAEPDAPSDDDDDEGGDVGPAEENKMKEPESDGSEDSEPPAPRRPLNTWMKASSAYRPMERARGDSDMHRKRSGTSHMRGSAHAGTHGGGGRKRSSTLDEDGRPSLLGASAGRVSLTAQERTSLTVRRSVFGDTGEVQQQHSKLHHNHPSAPPPPPPPPARRRLDSAIRDALKLAPTLRKAEAAPAKKVDLRSALMGAIKQGAVALKAVEVKPIEPKVQHAAIAAILANRGKIAGSDSDSDEDDSDSDMSM